MRYSVAGRLKDALRRECGRFNVRRGYAVNECARCRYFITGMSSLDYRYVHQGLLTGTFHMTWSSTLAYSGNWSMIFWRWGISLLKSTSNFIKLHYIILRAYILLHTIIKPETKKNHYERNYKILNFVSCSNLADLIFCISVVFLNCA